MSVTYRPRLSIEITDEQSRKLKQLIPWGLKNQLFQLIIDDVIDMLESHGEIALAAIMSHKLKVSSFPTIRRFLDENRSTE